jgi:uncharacterized protein YcnI
MAARNLIHRTAALVAALIAAAAQAHVTLADPLASAGSYYAGFFRVSHGCSGSPTVSIRIEIPPTIAIARPQPKPGWTLSVEKAAPGGRVTAITWSGRLEADQFDQFGMMLKLPDAPGMLFFPTIQHCETGENDWTARPAPGQDRHSLAAPAPTLEVTPAGEMPMDHMKM